MPNAKSGNVLTRFLGLLLYIPALLLMPFWESGKWLSKKAYGGGGFIRGIFVGITGVPFTIYGAIFAANVVGWHYHLSWPLWTVAGALGAALVGGIVWPALYLFPIKPIWDGCAKLFKWNEKFAKNGVQPFCQSLVSVVRHLPGSSHLWDVSEGKTKSGRKWGIGFLAFVLAVGGLCAGLAAGYGVYHLGLHLIPVFGALPLFSGVFLSQIFSAALAVIAVVFVTGFLWQYLFEDKGENGPESFTAVAYSAGIAYLAATKGVALLGLSAIAGLPAGAVAVVLALAYVVPGLLALLQGGLVDAVLKGWKNLLEASYDDEKDAGYALFFAQVANIVVAAIEAVIAYYVAGAIHLPHAAVLVITGVVALWSYASNPKELTGSRHVSPLFGATLALASGFAAWYFAPAAIAAHSFYQYGFGIIIALAVGFIAYPVAYLILRAITKPVSGPVGRGLKVVSDKAVSTYKSISDKVRKLQRAAFDDSTPYSGMFGHLFIITVIALALLNGVPLAIPFVHFAFWINAALTAFAFINVYMLLAKLSSSYGAETLSVTTGGIALLEAGHWALGVSGGSWWAAGVVGLAAAGIVGGLLAPAVYLAVRIPAKYVLTPWLAPLLKTIYDGLWAVYAGFWKKFSLVFKVLEAVFGPLFALMASIWKGVAAAYARMFGRH